MDDKLSDPSPPGPHRDATGVDSHLRDATAEYELRLRSTERVRLVLLKSSLRCSAPQHLVTRIRESLIIIRSG